MMGGMLASILLTVAVHGLREPSVEQWVSWAVGVRPVAASVSAEVLRREPARAAQELRRRVTSVPAERRGRHLDLWARLEPTSLGSAAGEWLASSDPNVASVGVGGLLRVRASSSMELVLDRLAVGDLYEAPFPSLSPDLASAWLDRVDGLARQGNVAALRFLASFGDQGVDRLRTIMDQTPELRYAALVELASLGSPAADRAILQVAQPADPLEASAYGSALAGRGPEALPEIERLIQGPDTVEAGMRALERLKGREAFELTVRAIERHRLVEWTNRLALQEPTLAAQQVETWARSREPHLRRQSLELMAEVDPDSARPYRRAWAGVVLGLCLDPDAPVAGDALARVSDWVESGFLTRGETTLILASALARSEPQLRIAAMAVADELADPVLLAAIRELAADPSVPPEVRHAAQSYAR